MPISVSTSSLLPSMSTRVTAYLVERRYLLQFFLFCCYPYIFLYTSSVVLFCCYPYILLYTSSVLLFCCYPYIFLLSSSVCLFGQLSVHFSVIFFSVFVLTAFRTFFCYLLQFFCSDCYPYLFSVYFFRFCVLTAIHTCFCLLVDTELWIHALVILYPVRSVTTVMSFTDMVVMLFGWSMLYQSPGPDSWSPWSTPADVVLLLVDFSSNKLCKYVCLLVSWDHM